MTREGSYSTSGSQLSIALVDTQEDLESVKALLRAYAIEIGGDDDRYKVLGDIDTLATSYAAPLGAIFLARHEGTSCGCVALKQRSPGCCELKRLFVSRSHRGLRIASHLLERVITFARSRSYESICLDSLRTMEDAIRLYIKFGFSEIPLYDRAQTHEFRCFKLDLQHADGASSCK